MRSQWIGRRWVSLKRHVLDSWNRLSSASKLEFVVNLLNIAARLYIVSFAVWYGTSGYRGTIVRWGDLWWLAGALLYAAVYPYLPKERFARKKWIQEDVRRKRFIGVAVSQLAASIEDDQFSPIGLHQTIQGLLTAIQSDMETVVVDTEGIYISVNLLVPDPIIGDNLRVIARSNPDRPLNVSYRKDLLVAGRAMQAGRWLYDPSFDPQAGRPYRSILAFPVIREEVGGGIAALGAVSIDSGRPHHFDGLEEKLETRLLPYLTLLRLALACRTRWGVA